MIFRRFATAAIAIGLLLWLSPALATTAESAAVMVPLHQFMDGASKGDHKMIVGPALGIVILLANTASAEPPVPK